LTIQLIFLPYFPYHFTIFFCIFQIISLFNLSFFHYFPYHFTFQLAFLPWENMEETQVE
jgi:hypothetical protein